MMEDQYLLLVRSGKGRKDRAVPFSVVTAKAIRRYVLKSRPNAASPHLFISKRGTALRPNSLLQLIERIAAAANVDHAHPHKFRHTFAVNYLRNGGDPLTLQRLMGHSTLAMTNEYVNLVTGDLLRGHQTASPLSGLLGHLKRGAGGRA